MSDRSPPAASALIRLTVVAAAFLYALLFHDKSIGMVEEGQILTEAEAILAGKVLYRDIDGYVAPGVWYLTAGVMALAGPSVNVTRLLMAVLFALQVGVVHALTERAASRRAALAAAGVLALLKVLAFPLGSFVWYTEFSVFFGLVGVWALFVYQQQGGRWRLVAAGTAAALAMVFKQNIGGYVWIALTLTLLLRHRSRRELLAFQLPVAAIGTATLAYFAAVGALPALLHGLLVVPFAGFYDAGRLSYLPPFAPRAFGPLESYIYTPILFWEQRFLRPGSGAAWVPVARGIAVGLYAVPVVVTLWAGLRLWRRRLREPELLLLLAAALALFLGTFPRADFAHVTQNSAGFVPLGAWLSARSRWRRALWIGAAPLAAVVGAFCWMLLGGLPYGHRLEHPRARVWVSEPVHRAITSTLSWLEEAVPPEEPVSFIPANPMYHFLSGRPVPHRYAVMMPPNIGFDGGASVVELLEENRVRYVVYGANELPGLPPFESFAPHLKHYLETRFSPVSSRRFRHWETVRILKRDGGS